MRFIVLLFLIAQVIYADMPSKIWTITPQNNIESTEDEFVPPAVDVVAEAVDDVVIQEQSFDELPLAKTYPATQSEQDRQEIGSLVHVADASAVLSKDDLAKRVQEIQSVIEKNVEKPQPKDTKTKTINSSVEKQNPTLAMDTEDRDKKSFYSEFIQNRLQIMVALAVAVVILFFVLYLLIRSPKKKNVTLEYTKSEIDDIAAVILERYTNIKGQMHKAFLQRKENIFFHDEFTPYQRAKSTLELEKEYNELEHIYLPKLFSNDVDKFVNGVEMIASKQELKEMLRGFATQMIEAGRFTKREKEYLQQKIKAFYNVAPQMPQNAKAAVPDKETAYFLQ